jgi:hemolysin III
MRCAPPSAIPQQSETRRSKRNRRVTQPAALQTGAAHGPSHNSAAEIAADRLVHLAGLILGGAGVPVLLSMAGGTGKPGIFAACAVYSATLVAMLVCSTLYHHGPIRADRQILRRLDHASIVLLIAGTYTPFTTCRLTGFAAVAMTAAVWGGALAGVAVKLTRPLGRFGLSTAAYLGLGWIVLIGLRPIVEAVVPLSLTLLAAGGLVYSLGVGIYGCRSLRFRTALWHALVVTAAACHFAAILHGVVLAG